MGTLVQREGILNEKFIDVFSAELQKVLENEKCEHKEIIKTRLAMEDVLLQWIASGGTSRASADLGSNQALSETYRDDELGRA